MCSFIYLIVINDLLSCRCWAYRNKWNIVFPFEEITCSCFFFWRMGDEKEHINKYIKITITLDSYGAIKKAKESKGE